MKLKYWVKQKHKLEGDDWVKMFEEPCILQEMEKAWP